MTKEMQGRVFEPGLLYDDAAVSPDGSILRARSLTLDSESRRPGGERGREKERRGKRPKREKSRQRELSSRRAAGELGGTGPGNSGAGQSLRLPGLAPCLRARVVPG